MGTGLSSVSESRDSGKFPIMCRKDAHLLGRTGKRRLNHGTARGVVGMGNVISIDDHRKSMWQSGTAICTRCDHEWEAVVPYGIEELKCPECKTMFGLFKYSFKPEMVLGCHCGGTLFYIASEGCMCRACGSYVDMENV